MLAQRFNLLANFGHAGGDGQKLIVAVQARVFACFADGIGLRALRQVLLLQSPLRLQAHHGKVSARHLRGQQQARLLCIGNRRLRSPNRSVQRGAVFAEQIPFIGQVHLHVGGLVHPSGQRRRVHADRAKTLLGSVQAGQGLHLVIGPLGLDHRLGACDAGLRGFQGRMAF